MKRGEPGWRSKRPPAGALAPLRTSDPGVTPPAVPRVKRAGGLRAISSLIAGKLRLIEWTPTYIGLLAYIFAVTTYRLPIGEAGMVVALAGMILDRRAIRIPPAVTAYAVFLAWALVTGFGSPYRDFVLDRVWESAKVGLIFLAVINGVRTRSQLWFFVVFFLACFGSHPARGTIVNYLTGNANFGRAAWNHIYANPNDMAALTLLQLSLGASLVMTESKGVVRNAAIAALMIFPIIILMTQSRGVMIGLAVFLLLAVAGHQRKVRTLAIIGCIATVVILVAPAGVWNRLAGLKNATSSTTLSAVDAEGSAAQRFAIWEVGARIIAEHPVAGIGLGAYPLANGDRSVFLGRRDAHSTYITLAAENGVVGLLLFCAVIALTFRYSVTVRRACRDVAPRGAQQLRYLELGLIGFLVAGIWGSYSKLAFLFVHMGLVWTVAASCERERRRILEHSSYASSLRTGG